MQCWCRVNVRVGMGSGFSCGKSGPLLLTFGNSVLVSIFTSLCGMMRILSGFTLVQIRFRRLN